MKNIYTCIFTALANILRHFCSIDLLVSSALGSNNRTLSSFQKRERETYRERKKEMAHIYHIHISFLNVILWLLLCLSSLWDCLIQKTYSIWVTSLLISRMSPKQHNSKAECVFSFALWSTFCLWWDALISDSFVDLLKWKFIVWYHKTMRIAQPLLS